MTTATVAKHTPGPWTADRMLIPPRAKDRRCGFVVNGPDDNGDPPFAIRICDLRVPRGIDGFAEGQANASLIAAAPDLLEACRQLIAMFDGEDECTEILDALGGPSSPIRAAIAKAEGR